MERSAILLGFFILGALFEMIQYQILSRAFNVCDLLGNGLGLLGVVPVVFCDKKKGGA